MPSIRVMDTVGGPNRRRTLLQCLGQLKLKVWSVQEGQEVLYVITGQEEVEPIFKPEVLTVLASNGFEPLVPPETKSLKTVVIRQLDSSYNHKTEEEFATSINERNEWAEVTEITKIPTQGNNTMVKAQFRERKMAITAMHKGIGVFDQTIPPLYIEQEVFIKLSPCSRCFCFTHERRNCNTPQIRECAKCGTQGHNSRNCLNAAKYCFNCQKEDHETFSRDCPIRKRILKEKSSAERKKERNRASSRHKTFIDKERKRNEKPELEEFNPFLNQYAGLPANAYVVILTALASATNIEVKEPGSFQDTYSEILKYNKIQDVLLPPSIIEKLTKQQQASAEEEEAMQEEEPPGNYPPNHQSTPKQKTPSIQKDGGEGQASGLTTPSGTGKRNRSTSSEGTYICQFSIKNPKNQYQTGQSRNKSPRDDQREKIILEKLREMEAKVFYPAHWADKTNNWNAILIELLKHNIKMTYNHTLDGSEPEELIREGIYKGLDMTEVLRFQGVEASDYNKLMEGDWSVLGVEVLSEAED